MSTKFIIMTVIAIILLYALYKIITSNYTTLGSMQNANNETLIPAASMPKTIPNTSAFSMWFYVRDWTCQTNASSVKPKNIISIKNAQASNLFSVSLGNCVNEVNVKVKCTTTTAAAGVDSTCSVGDFPLQKWVHLIVSVNGRALDVYVDGKLVKTCVLEGVPKFSDASQIVLGGGFEGFITNVKFKKDVIAPQEAWDMYSEGYGGNPFGDMLNKYKVKLSFVVDNIEQTSVST